MIVRSHQYWIEFPGYKIHHEGRVVTVIRHLRLFSNPFSLSNLKIHRLLQIFSAANYCGSARNGAAVVLMAENASRELVATFKTIPAFVNQ
jgi:hypothetical protein